MKGTVCKHDRGQQTTTLALNCYSAKLCGCVWPQQVAAISLLAPLVMTLAAQVADCEFECCAVFYQYYNAPSLTFPQPFV